MTGTNEYSLQDGYKDILSGESISFHQREEPWRVKITPKSPGSTFTVPSAFLEYLDAIDYGTPDGFKVASSSTLSAVCGDEVSLYFLSNSLNGAEWIFPDRWGELLSQVKVLHNAFPIGLSVFVNRDPVVIDSPEFTTEEGIWNYCDIDPVFDGSTFEVGPRVYGPVAMEFTQRWPMTETNWDPFGKCPNLKTIEFQGTLGDFCEQIYASKLVYKNEDGYEVADAYPDGGKPRIIVDAVGPFKSFHLDSGGRFPQYDVSELTNCQRPVVAEEVVLPTRSGSVRLPVGPDLRKANKLVTYFNGIQKITRAWADEDHTEREKVPLVYGIKILGLDLPDTPTLKEVQNAHLIWLDHAPLSEGDEIEIGFQATPDLVAATFNFSLASALRSHYGNNLEDLLIPLDPPEVEYMNRYAEGQVDDEYTDGWDHPYYYVKVLGNGELTGMTIPKIRSKKLRVLDGYMEKAFMYGRTGELTVQIPSGPTYSGNIVYRVPALPAKPRATPGEEGILVRNYLRFCCAYTSGKSETFINSTTPSTAQLVYGRVESSASNARPTVVLNLTEDWFGSGSPESEYLYDMIDHDNWDAMAKAVSTSDPLEVEVKINISIGGFEFEEWDTKVVSHAFNWQDYLFFRAEVDPRSIDNILAPLDKDWTKVDGAWNYALNLSTPLHNTVVYMDQWNLQEPEKRVLGGNWVYVPQYTLILGYGIEKEMSDAYSYKIEDIDIPDFVIGDDYSTVYNTWQGVFSYLIYGDIDSFKESHGIPDDVPTGGSYIKPDPGNGTSLGLGVLNWFPFEVNSFTYTVTIPSAMTPSGLGQRGFGVRLFRGEIPYYKDSPPLYGRPIFIAFDKVGKNWVWDGVDVTAFREAVAPLDPVETN